METDMSCLHHPGKAYVLVGSQLICPECGRRAPYQSVKSQAELLIENKQLKEEVDKLKEDKKFWINLGLSRD